MAAGGLQKRSETRLQVSAIEVMLNRAELFFASVLQTFQSRHPHIGCEVHTVFLLWDWRLERDWGASLLRGIKPDDLINRSVHPIKKLVSCGRLGRSGGRLLDGGLKFVLRLSGGLLLKNETGLFAVFDHVLESAWRKIAVQHSLQLRTNSRGCSTIASCRRQTAGQTRSQSNCNMRFPR